MAKHVILESYTFSPSTRTVVVNGKNIRREQLLLITNTTLGTVIYNFSDPGLLASSYVNSVDATTGLETTTIVLAYATGSMSATDKLSILVEETYQEMIPAETYRDPVDKLRTSTPQSLIDTDFEYGTQPTKWESINLLYNRPSAFFDSTAPTLISAISVSTRRVTITTVSAHNIGLGVPIFIQGTLDTYNADGWFLTTTGTTGSTLVFDCINAPAATLYDSTKTYLFIASFFTGAAIPAGTTAFTFSGSTITATTTFAHGLQPGNSIFVVGTSGPSTPINGSFIIVSTPSVNSFTFVTADGGTPSTTITSILNASIYPRAMGYVQHRPFDGGVQFTNVQPYHGYQVIRQTRRQFRYQSGKGIQFSTGSTMKPSYQVDNITSVNAVVTVTTKYPHGLLAGGFVKVSGCDQTAYNGTFQVTSASGLTFTYNALSTPSASPATGYPITVVPWSWYGNTNRVGMFDHQNGFYFEFDGQTLYACRRKSTDQIAGVVAVTLNNQSVTGTSTKFSNDLKPGDSIVIRGMSYVVQSITSDTQMYIYPEYRGVTAVNCVVSKTTILRFPQSQWNIDRLDGTGASGMNLDLSKMQMFYIDYTWYGAGAIRFGFKNNRGEVIFCHRIANNNVNNEAYLRSGNLVARYEINHMPFYTYLTATLAAAATAGSAIYLKDTSIWPSTGTVVLSQSGNTNVYTEYITYSANSTSTGVLTVNGRAQTGGTGTAVTFSYAATQPVLAQLYSPQQASSISHWGSSVIMDGRFDDDKSYVFNAGFNTPLVNYPIGRSVPVMSLRLGPSVDNGLIGVLGTREIVNRMQLTLRNLDLYAGNTPFKMEIILNGRVSAGTWTNVGGSSLAQIAYHSTTTTISGGENIYGFFSNVGAATDKDLNQVRDIGTSILGGGTTSTISTSTANVYPDGPDMVTICATAITSATNTLNSRVSWTEAQA